jgi:preprotein translocase subunit SecE
MSSFALKSNFMSRLYLFSILIFSSICSGAQNAQTDYLINTRGDTIRGQISFLQLGTIDQVQVKGAKRQSISAVQVREVYLKGKRYKPVQFAGAIKFMQILTEGYLSLLAFQPPGLMTFDGRLLQKRDGVAMEVPSLGFKKQMSNFIKEYDEMAKQITDGTLDRKDLDKIISGYNEFISGKTASVKAQSQLAEKQKSKLELLDELKSEIEKTEMPNKQDALDMVADVGEKINGNKPLPNYLVQLLKSKVSNQTALEGKLNLLLEGLK